jgi:hypothetical protein
MKIDRSDEFSDLDDSVRVDCESGSNERDQRHENDNSEEQDKKCDDHRISTLREIKID